MKIITHINNSTYEVTFSGRFTFDTHIEFREVLNSIAECEIQNIVIHVSHVEFIDSAALGMLLLAYDEASRHNKQIAIHGAQGQVRKMLDMAQFNMLFTLT